MKILVFGATGGVGRQVVEQGLAAGFDVTAFVRNSSSLGNQDGLAVIEGDTFNLKDVRQAIAGQNAIISCLGGRPWRKERVCSRAINHIIKAAQEHAVR